jgi:hypothetical protein
VEWTACTSFQPTQTRLWCERGTPASAGVLFCVAICVASSPGVTTVLLGEPNGPLVPIQLRPEVSAALQCVCKYLSQYGVIFTAANWPSTVGTVFNENTISSPTYGTSSSGSVSSELVVDRPFSPPALQAPLQTSTVQADNRTTGVLVSLIGDGRSTPQNHLSSYRKHNLHLVDATSQPDATGFSGDDAASRGPAADVDPTVVSTKMDCPARSTILPTPRA